MDQSPLRNYRVQDIPLPFENQSFASRMYRARLRHPLQSVQFSQSNNQINTSTHQVPRPQNIINEHSGSIQAIEQISRGHKLIPIGCNPSRNGQYDEMTIHKFYRMPISVSFLREKQGTNGEELNLVANYFPIKSYTNWTLYQYKINFSPEENRTRVKRCLLFQHRDKLGAYTFDGTMLFSCTKYDSMEFMLSSKRDSDNQIVVITVLFIDVLEPDDYYYTQVFKSLLRILLRHLEVTVDNYNYYDPEAKVNILKHKLQLWPGYKATFELCDYGILLKADILSKFIREETILDFFQNCLENDHEHYMDNFRTGVIGNVVITRYNNKTYKILDVDETLSPKNTFKMKDGKLMTLFDYYKKKWNVTIHEDNQPLLISKKKKTWTNILNKNYDNDDLLWLVPELCSSTGIYESMKRNFTTMKELTNYKNVNPLERITRYNNFMNRIQSAPESVKLLKDWNLKLQDDLLIIKGRVLNQQKIFFNDKVYLSGIQADWTSHVCSLPMFTSAILQHWVVLYPNQNENEVRAFIKTIRKVGDNMSFKIPQPEFHPINADVISGYSAALEEIINQLNPSLILCVVKSDGGDVYSLIKQHLCVKRAVPSQVVLLKNVIQNNLSVCNKIVIQINCKLGGAPWKISIPTPGIMIIGFDICFDKHKKMYVALIASVNDDHTKYYNHVKPCSNDDLFQPFDITEALNSYRNLNQKLPSMIIIYRVVKYCSSISICEIELVKKNCKNVYGAGSEPPMAFILVEKQTNSRFFRAPEGSSVSNPPPGTIVDSVVTNPAMYDFFLMSEHKTSGTVTSVHYNVVMDTLPNWSPDKMHLLTYKLTHMYYNCSSTVQIPAHCQLAQKLAHFASQYLKRTPNVTLNKLLYFL